MRTSSRVRATTPSRPSRASAAVRAVAAAAADAVVDVVVVVDAAAVVDAAVTTSARVVIRSMFCALIYPGLPRARLLARANEKQYFDCPLGSPVFSMR